MSSLPQCSDQPPRRFRTPTSSPTDYGDRFRREPLGNRLFAVAAKEHFDAYVHFTFGDEGCQKLFGEAGRGRWVVQWQRIWNNRGNQQFERRTQIPGEDTGKVEACLSCIRIRVDHVKPE